ncbi:MAG: precorrin-8X methylmutase [Lachnospiraceae bacterium]|nr:precorrin-8X methylmutase [Lachnospiraceae bacterium]
MQDIEFVKPEEIERKSFEIIKEALEAQNISVPLQYTFLPGEDPEPVKNMIYRCIHTTADLDYAGTLRFSKGSVSVLRELLRSGADIVTDTNMALAGINKKVLSRYGGRACCFMADEEVAKAAAESGVTRAYAAMEKASGIYGAEDGKPVIFAVGNAPTALISLYEMYKEKRFTPDFLIGVPVGFVNVTASKELIMKTDIPYIINEGNKGGSPVASAIVNAVLYSL